MKSIPQYLRIGLFSALLILSMYSHPARPAGAKTSVKETGSAVAAAQVTNEYYLYAATYSTKGAYKSTLVLNNAVNRNKEVQITLRNRKGESLVIPEIVLAPYQVEYFDLADWLKGPDKARFSEGSASLETHSYGSGVGVGAGIIVSDEDHNISFDVPFIKAEDYASSQLESLWWTPDDKTEIYIFLANTTNNEMVVTPTVYVSGEAIDSTPIILRADESMGIGLAQLLGKLGKKPIERVGGIRLSHNQKPGELAVAGASLNKQSGFSSTLQFTDAKAQGGTTLHGAHLPIGLPAAQSGFPSETRFTPYAFVRNTTNLPVNVKGKVRYTIENTSESIEISEITLAANEIRKIDLSGVIPTIESQILIDAGIELEHTGQPGAMIAAVASIDQSGDQIIDVPIRDPNSRMSTIAKGGVYPWRIDGGNRAVVHLKNIDSDINGVIPSAIAQIRFDGGIYNLPLLLAEPGQTIAIDINKLRDEQIPDSVGKIIPAHITKGEIVWYDRGELGQFVGRLVQYNTAKGSASSFSYATGCCSGLSSLGGEIVPGNATASLGSSFTYTVIEVFEDQCAGDIIFVNVTNRASFSSSNQSVAKASGTIGNSTVQCLGAGNATITATWVTTILQNGGGFCRILRSAATGTSFLLVKAPTVSIGTFTAVGKDLTAPISISFNAPSLTTFTLKLSATSGTGEARFQATDSNTLTTTGAGTITVNEPIKGIQESSTANNIRLEIKSGSVTLATHDFTVLLINLEVRTSGPISADNDKKFTYQSVIGKDFLDTYPSSGTLSPIRFATGVEIVGVIQPSNFTGLIGINRIVDEARLFKNGVEVISAHDINKPDSSFSQLRDDDPQSNSSGGKVYDLDAPGANIVSAGSADTIIRLRQNFHQFAVVDFQTDGATGKIIPGTGAIVSAPVLWSSAVSVIVRPDGSADFERTFDIFGDNRADKKHINLTNNLH
jgi:hypothetical protein